MKKILLPLSLTILLAGCATSLLEQSEKEVEALHRTGQDMLANIRQGEGAARPQKRPFIEKNSGIWIASRRISEREKQTALGKISEINIAINRQFDSPLALAERVTTLTGIPVSISPDVYGKSREAPAQAASANGAPIVPALSGNGYVPSFGNGVYLTYNGNLAGFLDVASARYGVSWRWTGKEIHLFRFMTKTFRIHALPGETNLQNMISNETGNTNDDNDISASSTGTQASSSSGGSVSSSGITIADLNVWTGIKETVGNMLSHDGKLSVSPATGTLTVTDIPSVIDTVEHYVNEQNASLNKQVTFNVKVLAVELSQSDEYGINWDLVYQNVSRSLSLGLSNSFEGAANAGSMTASILPGGGSPWANSQAILSALSQQGRVSQVTSASLTTLNNQPVPLQVGNQLAYLASSQTTISQGVGSSTALQPGLVSTGFSMSLVPHILGKGKMFVQFSINISSLLNMTQVTSGDSTIQTPEVNTRNFLQRVKIHKGETLVLTGFEQVNLDTRSQGIGNPRNVLLGGGIARENNRTVMVILIQPV